MKKIIIEEVCKLFEGTDTKVFSSNTNKFSGEGLFINIESDGIKYNHTGSEYYIKSELLTIEISVHHVDNYESILDEAVDVITRLIFTNEKILENLETTPELEVLSPDYDDLGSTNRSTVEINMILNQSVELSPVHPNELAFIGFDINHNNNLVHSEILDVPE